MSLQISALELHPQPQQEKREHGCAAYSPPELSGHDPQQ
jgi:hypothetical protein